jgi:hypothetical protein
VKSQSGVVGGAVFCNGRWSGRFSGELPPEVDEASLPSVTANNWCEVQFSESLKRKIENLIEVDTKIAIFSRF